MGLRGKTFLSLLPVILPLLIYNLFQFHARVDAVQDGIQDVNSLAASAGADELNGFLWSSLNAFSLLTERVNRCNLTPDHLDTDQIKDIGVSLRTNPHFSLLALTGRDGQVRYAQPAPVNSNRHILPRSIDGQQLLDPEQLQRLEAQFQAWQLNIDHNRKQLLEAEQALNQLIAVGQFNSARYRQLQQRVAQLAVTRSATGDVDFGGGETATAAGLPFSGETFLFISPISDCSNQLVGYLVALLDWTRVEDILFKYVKHLQTGGLEQGDVFLLHQGEKRLLSAASNATEMALHKILSQPARNHWTAGQPLEDLSQTGFLSSHPIADATILRATKQSLATDHPISHNRFHDLVRSRSLFSLVTFTPEAEWSLVANELWRNMLLWSLFSVLLMVALILLLSNSVVAPITALARTMSRFTSGDLKARVGVERQDEIGNLSRAFNDMAEVLKTQREDLHANLSLLSTTLDSTADGVLVVDRYGATVLHNRRFSQMWEIPANLLNAHDDHALQVHMLDQLGNPDAFLDKLQAVLKDPDAISRDQLRFKDGRVFDLYSQPQVLDGVSIGRVWCFRDVTERCRAEQDLQRHKAHLEELVASRTSELAAAKDAAEAASRAKSIFLAHMSHEVRTPLNGLFGMIDLLRMDDSPENRQQNLAVMERSAHALLRIIDDILDFSRIEAGRMELVREPMDVTDVGRDVTALYGEEARHKGVELIFTTDEDISPRLVGDPSRLRQILLNLISNAVKFTDRGSIQLGIEKLSENPRHQQLRFSVRDSGVGIPATMQRHIFEAFSQADQSSSRRYGGSGLGLAISQRLVTLMGGELNLKSTPEQGSRFWFDLDLAIADEPAEDISPDTVPVSDTPPRLNLNILVVEDNKVNQVVSQEMLKAMDCRCTIAEDGIQGLEAFEQGNYDLILMDCEMPNMSGYEATAKIREQEQALGMKAIPIVALTAHALPENREKSRQAGMNDFLSKPFNMHQLAGAICRQIKTDQPKNGS